jgi:hypothetical protein
MVQLRDFYTLRIFGTTVIQTADLLDPKVDALPTQQRRLPMLPTLIMTVISYCLFMTFPEFDLPKLYPIE